MEVRHPCESTCLFRVFFHSTGEFCVTVRRGDPGVAADPNFAEENWDEADAPAPAPAKRLVKKKKAPSGAASDTKMTES
jgi:hypothetical protein